MVIERAGLQPVAVRRRSCPGFVPRLASASFWPVMTWKLPPRRSAERDHRFTQRHASEYLDGELSTRGLHRIERHLLICAQCRQVLDSLRRTLTAMRGLRARPAPGLGERFVMGVREEGASPGGTSTD
jgi:hypothetical protein